MSAFSDSFCSPEKHGIVVCGDSIASRPGMPESYAKMKQFLQKDAMERSTFKEVFSEQLCYVNNVMDQVSYKSTLPTFLLLTSLFTDISPKDVASSEEDPRPHP